MSFESKKPQPVSFWLEYIEMTQDLVAFAMDTPCAALKQTLLPSEAIRNADPAPRSEVILYTKGIVAPRPDEPEVSPREALFTLHDIEFDAVMRRWVDLRHQFTMACHMIVGFKYVSRSYLENQLLTAAGAAEVMHRKLERDPPVPEAEFNDLKDKLLAAVPEKRRKWLEGKLYNEPTLKERLVDLASIPDADVMKRLLPDAEKWAKASAAARNGIAHRARTTSTSKSVQTYHPVVGVTTAVVIVNLLHVLAIPKERVLRALVDNDTFSKAAKLSFKHWPRKEKGEKAGSGLMLGSH